MENFLIKYYMFIIYGIQLVAVVAGLIFYKKYKATPVTFFIKIIFYLFLVQFLGSYAHYYDTFDFLNSIYNSVFRNNYWYFTIFFDIGAIVLFSIFFQRILTVKLHVKVLKIATYLFVFFATVYLLVNYQKFFYQYFSLLQIIGALVMILSSVLYYLELLQSNTILKFYSTIYFYIASAIFVWWIITTPISFFDLYTRGSDWNFIFLEWQIYLFANFFMYLVFTIGLIVSKPEK
ncbi:hypothetical protein [uncultured Lacinutrix sp.]|uniref:hypothetical protein n=1 Tax=uncultured Lacinutrix sp. TaxID=574032 RepID=UPI00262C84FE|nr:hypothetical protein [uncultured Lacinutrix sp.]